jgi:hypothetical protein
MTRVLLFCPTVKLSRATFEAIHGLQFDGALDRMFTHDNPNGEHSGLNIIYNYRKAERIIKTERYDYLLTVEDDIIPPPDAVEKMIGVNSDIVYGVYCFRKGKPTINISRPDDLMQSYSLPHNLAEWKRLQGRIVECGGLGLGCTLIKRRVFDALSFHSVKGGDVDTQLAIDAQRLGLRQMCDTTVRCGHRRANGMTVWPTEAGFEEHGIPGPEPARLITAQRPIVFWDYAETVVRLEPGETRAVDLDHAAAYVEMGLAVYA